MANEWADLMKDYWKSNSDYGNPSDLKKVISKKVKIFYGYGQQDSNEFMTYFLDIMNEDLNRTSKKPYKEIDEQKDNESDDQCASRFWKYNYERNNSIITDLFTGLFKCTVKCPQCGWISITYEPFNILQLPIPYKKINKSENINLFFIPKYGLYKTIRLKFFLKDVNITLDKLTEEIKKLCKFPFKINNLYYYNVSDSYFMSSFEEKDNYKNINKNFIFCCENDIDYNENNIIEDKEIYKTPLYFFKDINDMSAYPRILFLNNKMSLIDLIKKMYFYARRFIKTPNNNENNNKIKEYFDKNEKIENLIELIDQEFSDIFLNKEPSEEILKFKENLPFKFTLRKGDKISFDLLSLIGKESQEEELNIEQIIEYLKKQNYYITIMIKSNHPFSEEKISLNSCTIVDESKEIENDNNFTLFDCFEYFKEKETLKKGNEWYCKKCKIHNLAEKQMEFYYLPKLFVVCLKRFSSSRSYWGGLSKNNEFVDFPLENMDMAEFVCGPDKNHCKYDCFAVSLHFGGLGGGHYTAACKNIDNNWYYYNDSSCDIIKRKKDIISNSAYVIFYRRQTD